MKKSMMFGILILLAVFPDFLQAQEIQLPTVEIKVTQDKVPPTVKSAFLKDFGEGHKPIVWATTQTNFDTYGWEQTVNVRNQEIIYYALHTKTTVGSTLDVLYTPDGKLVRSREEIKKFEPPSTILASLEKSNYKDWKIAKDVHIVKVYGAGSTKEHYDLKMEKGRQKKVVYFDKDGNMLMNKKGL